MVVHVNKQGYMDEAMMLEWIRVVWNCQPGALLHLCSMLVLDAFCGNLTDAVKRTLGDGKMNLAVIPGGITSTLQPIDVVLKKPFKDRVQLEYQKWVCGDNTKTLTGRLHRAPLVTVCGWVLSAWRSLPDYMVEIYLRNVTSANRCMARKTTHCEKRPVTNSHLLKTVVLRLTNTNSFDGGGGELRRSKCGVPDSQINVVQPFQIGGVERNISIESLCDLIRSVVRDKLQKIQCQSQPTAGSICSLVKNEVRQTLQVPPSSYDPPVPMEPYRLHTQKL
ncbi:hypothetical protein HPB51_008413 [Rhipicephalus microplus]|uniref:DDE-1 domain-containing protein n=1 Tax=Rhipicephalus microplus TaxID=6941 RepID=A0A9J6DG44_RHIMP|nr:hypothetical protein HPB51_008413 [Rhipicephalus microplus]